ncbi:hypothetical protein C8J57DRAFT_981904, partial [Mycena rebaudengoi]
RGRFLCALDGCTKTASSLADMRRHRECLAHVPIDPSAQRPLKPYACLGCPYRFTRDDAMKRHVRARSS